MLLVWLVPCSGAGARTHVGFVTFPYFERKGMSDSNWYAQSDEQAATMRAAIHRSRMGYPQTLHRHPYDQECNEQCELI